MSEKPKPKQNNNLKWVVQVTILSFTLSIIFSFISNIAVSKLSVIPAILILILVIFIGVIFDIVGVAVTVADESEIHAKASKKIKGAKESINLIKNSSKVSNLCADVIGDICGVLSGAISATISLKLTSELGLPDNIQFFISAIVASFTIGGKAIGKDIAKRNATKILGILGNIMSRISKK